MIGAINVLTRTCHGWVLRMASTF